MFLSRILRGKETVSDITERLGVGLRPSKDSTDVHLWLHGASNGELTAARSIIEEALDRDPTLNLLITTNTLSARDMLTAWALPRVSARLAPLDFQPVLSRFLRAYTPAALITLENEIWPNRFVLASQADIPVIVAGARMSERSARRWQKMRPLFGRTMRNAISAISYLAAQDTASEQRLLQLGVPARVLLPRMNLKSTVDMAIPETANLPELERMFPRATTLLAASTHEGEERIVLDAFKLVRAEIPEARLILAPRHPARADAIIAELTRSGLSFARRSRGDDPSEAAVLLADTLGEMALWYSIAGVAFVGGSLVPRGGHTPFEPAQLETAILHGPHVSNHMAAYRALDVAQASIAILGTEDLAAAVTRLFKAPDQRAEMTTEASRIVQDLRDSPSKREAFWKAVANAPDLHKLA
ncbi:3-deoxy-D-manno-octulosonic acid transferase [Celeribacter sp. ASW11-22]|nr:3-deoxy-D-manno-octulosonic acid transferase [Celeribacter litoreus]